MHKPSLQKQRHTPHRHDYPTNPSTLLQQHLSCAWNSSSNPSYLLRQQPKAANSGLQQTARWIQNFVHWALTPTTLAM